jgi:hypothetical protein
MSNGTVSIPTLSAASAPSQQAICKRLAEIQFGEHDRQRAMDALRDAAAIAAIVAILLLAAAAIAGCGDEGKPAQSSTAGRTGKDVALLETNETDERDPLRIRTDTARGRSWVLGLDDVRVYDITGPTKRLIRQVTLPGWSIVRFMCDPDMVLDSAGAAIISSNVPARLWTIGPDNFEVKRHEISLWGKEQWDIGFGALAFAADGTLVALTSSANSSWKINIASATASMIESYHPPLETCALASRSEPY